MEEAHVRAKYHAILIGINYYPKGFSSLEGCVKDVQEIKDYLQHSPSQVSVHIFTASSNGDPNSSRPAEAPEKWPTHDNITSCMNSVTSAADPGDFLYIHFSGHGTAIEPSSPYSNSSTGDLALDVLHGMDTPSIRYLRGLELASLLRDMVKKQLTVSLVLDCCFSGSVMRNDSSVRYLTYDPAIDAAYPPLPRQHIGPEDEASYPAYRDISMRPNWLVNPDGYTILTACGPTERARELKMNGQKRGILSYFLIRTFVKLGGVLGKQRDIYTHLCARFRETRPQREHEQNPLFYGNKSLGFFGPPDQRMGSASIPILRTLDGGHLLEAGAAHGVCNKDQFAVYVLDSSEPFLIAEIIRTGPLTSSLAPLNKTSMPNTTGLTATALTHFALRKFPVKLELDTLHSQTWTTLLEDRSSLSIQNTDSFSFCVGLTIDNLYEIRDASNQKIPNLPSLRQNGNETSSQVLDMVEHLALFKMVKVLSNEALNDPAHSFRECFSVRLIKSANKIFYPGCVRECSHPECLVEVEAGDELQLEVENKHGDDLYLHIYNMGPYWDIENIFRGDHTVIPSRFNNKHEGFSQGTTGVWKSKLTMEVPGEMIGSSQVQYEDVIKIFLTAQPISFMLLELPKISSFVKQKKSNRTRGKGGRSEDWAALNFRIRTNLAK